MRVLLDTNVLLSAMIFPNGVAAKAFAHATEHQLIVSEYTLLEARSVIARKFPEQQDDLEGFLLVLYDLAIVAPIPELTATYPDRLRDPKDWPIWQSALEAKAEVLVTGDRDFLDSDLSEVTICSPAQFLALA